MGDYRNKVWLEDQYVNQKKSMGKISKEFGCGRTTIETWLKKHGIPRRSYQSRLASIGELNKKWLTKEYIDKGRSTTEIGEELGIDRQTINRYIDKFGIKKRTISENTRLTDDRLNKKWLTKQYIDENRSMEDIAIEIGAGSSTIERYLRSFNIPVKTPYSYGRNAISSPHKNILIPYLEENKIIHTTSYVLQKLDEQKSTAHPYEIDEYLPEHNVFLDLHGDYWHKLDKSIKSDARKKKLIKKHFPNIIYLVIWENEVKKGDMRKLDSVINK